MWVFHYQVKILRRNEKFIYAKKCFCKDVLNLSVTWVTWLHSSSKNKKIKNKKINSVKISYIFSKKIIIFWVMEFSGPMIKEKSFLIFFKKKVFLIFWVMELSYIFFKKRLPIFQLHPQKFSLKRISYILVHFPNPGSKFSPEQNFLYSSKKS